VCKHTILCNFDHGFTMQYHVEREFIIQLTIGIGWGDLYYTNTKIQDKLDVYTIIQD